MRHRFLILVSTIPLFACGSTDAQSASGHTGGSGGVAAGGAAGITASGGASGGVGGSTGGTAGQPSGGAPASCSELQGSQSLSALTAKVEQLQNGLWQTGWNVNSATGVESDFVGMQPINAPLSASTTPELAALQFVSELPNSPFVPAEYQVAETAESFGAKTVTFSRYLVGGVKTHFKRPGLIVLVEPGSDGVWRLLSFSFYPSVTYATQAEIDQLAACTSEVPPDLSKIYQYTFHGLLFEQCGPIGTYDYLPKSDDKLEWQDPLAWEGAPDGVIHWKIVRPAHFIIDPKNYWEKIGYSDCICDDVAGYTIVADFISGEVLSYTPGINCVVC